MIYYRKLSTVKRLMLLKRLSGSGEPIVVKTITGVLPKTFHAVAHAIASLTRYGLCTQDGTPTPDAPVDILCNNGALCVVDDELPTGYKRLLGITFDGEVYYTTNYHMRGADTLRFSFKATETGRNVIGCYNGTDATDNLSFYFSTGSTGVYLRYNGGLYRPVAWTNTSYNCVISPTGVTGLSTDASWTEADFTSAAAMFIGWLDNATSPKFIGDMYGSIVVDGRASFIPVERQSDGAIGYWDGQAFLENQGTGTPVSLGYDTSHYQLSVGGTHPGQNLVDLTAVTDDFYYDQNGVYTAAESARLSDFIPVKAGQKYTAYVANLGSRFVFNVRVNLFSTDRVWLSQSATPVTQPSVIVITPTEDGYLRLSANYKGTSSTSSWADWSTLQIVRGEYTLATMPPYEPYTEIPYTPEVLTVRGTNLLDPATSNIIIGETVPADGSFVVGVNNWRTDYIPIVGGKTYAFWGRKKEGNTISAYNRINWYTADKVNIAPRPSYTINTVTIATAPSNAAYAILSCAPINSSNPITRDAFDKYNWMFAEASTEIPFEPYVTPQTVTVPMLLSVGGYKDTAELINGIKTGKVGIKVFDGTEDFTASSSGAMITTIPDVAIGAENNPMNTRFDLETSATSIAVGTQRFGSNGTKIYSTNYYMKHPTITTAPDFKVWLASLFAAGNPAIMVYPRATETTEQTTPHNLVTHKGTNVVDSVANVEPVEVEIQYYDNSNE